MCQKDTGKQEKREENIYHGGIRSYTEYTEEEEVDGISLFPLPSVTSVSSSLYSVVTSSFFRFHSQPSP